MSKSRDFEPGDCRAIQELMLVDRELSAFEAGRIERHVSACVGCQSALAGDDLPLLEVPMPSSAEWDILGQRLRAEPLPRQRRSMPLLAPVAALILVSVVLIGFMQLSQTDDQEIDVAQLFGSADDLAEETIEIDEIPDGAQVMIYADEGVPMVWISSG